MFKVGLIGFGRIGRSLFRLSQENPHFEIVAVNEIIEDMAALEYALKYDSIYGTSELNIHREGQSLYINDKATQFFHKKDITNVPWKELGVDLVVDASGVFQNAEMARSLIDLGVKNVLLTNAFKCFDKMIVFGSNEDELNVHEHKVISGSICDVVGSTPILKLVDDRFGITGGTILTLHPWLGYQNLLDSPLLSTSVPGTTYSDFALGRASSINLIPKHTSVVSAMHNLPNLQEKLNCMSYRVPTAAVASANLSLTLKQKCSETDLNQLFDEFEKNQSLEFPVLKVNRDPLVSMDFRAMKYFSVLDARWSQVNSNNNSVNLVAWYDNEFGYGYHTTKLIELIKRKYE